MRVKFGLIQLYELSTNTSETNTVGSKMWQPYYQLYPPPPPSKVGNNAIDFRQDSTACTACTRHLFRTEAIRCQGICKGEFHAECSARYEWKCGKCRKENAIDQEDFDKLTSAVDGINKNLIKTDAKIAGLLVETMAGKISDNVEISELRTEMRNMHNRFEDMEEQMNEVKAAMNTAMIELKTTISGLESKITALTTKQKQFDQIDVSGIEDTLRNASQLVLAEMTSTLDRLLEEKTQLEKQNQRQTSLSNSIQLPADGGLLEENTQMFKLQQLLQQQRITKRDDNKGHEEEKTPMKRPSQRHQKTNRLQQLAAQFQLQ